MDEKSCRLLEFPKITALLAERASFSLGKEMAGALLPSASRQEVALTLRETAQAADLLVSRGMPPFGGARDIRPHLKRCRIGTLLSPGELFEVAQVLSCIRRLRAYLLGAPDEGAAVAAGPARGPLSGPVGQSARTLTPEPRLEADLNQAIDPEAEGGVRDAASPELSACRSRKRAMQARVRERLDALVRSPHTQKFLQEAIITLRHGRYVVPVRQDAKANVPGIVHDQSGSGATLFVEPMAVVELNNQLREIEAAEEAEIERILSALSGRVAAAENSLEASLAALGRLDFAFAKAKLAGDWEAVEPAIDAAGELEIRQGRHPLLGPQAVPIDVRLGRDFTILVITGPNTGGKTVTLKTVGLLVLMAQAGLFVPAASGTRLPLFGQVWADIGDEQSIEQSLSTFSSHMTNIVRIIRRAGPEDLVLLDEIGAGTDPEEGAALAMALLLRLREIGSRGIATTHYSELKSFAYSESGLENASVEFDVETLSPTYRLSIGIPGQSNAFLIARRLGLDEAILSVAKGYVAHESLRAGDLLREVEAARREARADRDAAARLKHEYEELRERYEAAWEKLTARRAVTLAEAEKEARRIVDAARREADELVGRLRRRERALVESGADSTAVEGAAGAGAETEELGRTVREELRRLGAGLARSEEAPVEAPAKLALGAAGLVEHGGDARALAPGDPVRVISLNQAGEVIRLLGAGDEVLVQVGPLRVNAARQDLVRIGAAASRPASAARLVAAQPQGGAVSHELDLRGRTVDEALAAIDKYLDSAMLAGLGRAWLIHGKGTGALRSAVQDFVRQHPRVTAYRFGGPQEGGDGVTVVEIE